MFIIQLDNYFAEGDLDGILSMYDSDIELIEPQTPICRGLGGMFILNFIKLSGRNA